MIWRFLLLLIVAGLSAQPAMAQTASGWPSYEPQTATWPVQMQNELGTRPPRPSTPPPVYTNGKEPADIPSAFDRSLLIGAPDLGGQPLEHGYYTAAQGATEAKARFILGKGIAINKDDTIRNWCQPNAAHLHQYVGAVAAACDTYASLRALDPSKGGSAGGALNATPYWFPCPLYEKIINGVNTKLCLRAQSVILYYNVGTLLPSHLAEIWMEPRNLAQVFGTNMDDPEDLVAKQELIDATAANVAAGGKAVWAYSGNGFSGWACQVGISITTPYFKSLKQLWNSANRATNCPPTSVNSESRLVSHIDGANCWDGVNLSSPTGYRHLRRSARETNYSVTDVCPVGWYRFAEAQLTFHFVNEGNFGDIVCSSDAAATIAAGRLYEGCESFHTDRIGAWAYGTDAQPDVQMKWMKNCNGARRSLAEPVVDAHECDSSRISLTENLKFINGRDVPPESPVTVDGNYFVLESASSPSAVGRGGVRPGRPGRPGRPRG